MSNLTDRIVQLILAVILAVLLGGVLNAWEIAGQRCSEAIDQARQADPSRKAGQK
jgi:hypothetical protein